MKKSTSTVLVLGVSLLFLLISAINDDANAVELLRRAFYAEWLSGP